jgi:hypothetical protein
MPLKNNWVNGDLFTPAAANDMANVVNAFGPPTATGQAVVTAANAAAARAAINANIYVNALDFGATGDGTTDDTVALQAWLDFIVTEQRQGWLPNGTYKITDTLVAPSGYGWSLSGENQNYAVIEQATANIPVLQLGTTLNSHTYTVENLMLKHATAQPSTNTLANCLLFEGETNGVGYFLTLRNIRFVNGFYAMKYTSGKVAPWGCLFDNLWMNGMSGGLLDNTGTITGIPGNKWGRFYIDCGGCIGPIFKNWSASAMTVGTLEFLNATNCQLITTQSGFNADIGAIRTENCTYTTGMNVIDFTGDYWISIGVMSLDVTAAPASGVLYLVVAASGSAADCHLDISSVQMSAAPVSGVCVVTGGGGTPNRKVSIGNALLNGWGLHAGGYSATGNYTSVRSWLNGALSTNKGDANYTVTVGDPNVVQFSTAFTAQRTITLPSGTSDVTCAGLYYDLVFDGAINGSNTALIKAGGTTLRTQTVDKVRLRYMWRRSGGGEWVLTDVTNVDDTLRGKTVDLGSNTVTGTLEQFNTAVSDANLAKTTDVQTFTSSGTWTKPAGAVSVRVRCIGAGGGGGAGARGPSGTALSGGGGGSSGGMSEMMLAASDLSSTVTVTVGTGGAGGIAQSLDGTAGANGSSASSSTSFGGYITAGGGNGGVGGGLATAGTGGNSTSYGYSAGMFPGVSGASGSAAGSAGASSGSGQGAAPGGGGGGVTTAPAATAGGNGGQTWSNTSLAYGTSGSGANGGAGGSSAVKGTGGGGGGGGGNISGTGYAGGAGGNYGGGGGGGGASLNGSTSGAGGKGGDGICIVTTYF